MSQTSRFLAATAVLLFLPACPLVEQGDTGPPADDAGETGPPDADAGGDSSVEPAPAEIQFPESRLVLQEGDVEEPTATVLDESGQALPDARVEWSSADPSIIEISSADLAVGRAVGETELTATVGDLEKTWPAEVVGAGVAEVTVVPEETTLRVGTEIPFAVTLRDEANAPVDDDRPVDWSTTDTEVATIDDSGVATGVNPGETEVVATVEGVEGRADLSVTDVPVESVEISPANPTPIAYGTTHEFEVTSYDIEGNPLTTQPAVADWTSSDPDVATIDDTGVAEGLSPGQTTVTATIDGMSDTVDLSVYFHISELAAGAGFSCAVAVQDLFCVGANDEGQLADGSLDDKSAFHSADFDKAVETIALGDSHGCLIDGGGDVWCWGANGEGQVDPDGDATESEPILAFEGSVQDLSAGTGHSCVVETGGRVTCWGDNSGHQLGDGDESTDGPIQVSGPVEFTEVAAGDTHTCAIGTDESGYCWGDNSRGQLGGTEGDSVPDSSDSPSFVQGGYEFVSLSAGLDFTCGVGAGEPPSCWGANGRGQLGVDKTDDQNVPLFLASDQGESYSSIAAGDLHACGLADGGALRCWGAADDGRLARDTSDDAVVPRSTDTDLTFSGLASGRSHSCGRTQDDRVFCWGTAPGDGPSPVEIDFEL